ncbi:MAG TPA: hypothetical protein ENH65_07220 [Candidatus Aminicenantes bacterium]|nr:hypothetical protein [Candidatus Aminicenantes bacterium]
MQKTFGGMPNMEFVIDSDGTLLASWEWANPKQLKEFLEKKVGPSGISDEEWKEISKKEPMLVSLKDNDEVPGTEVPRPALSPLEVNLIAEPGDEKPPFTLKAGTLPPEVTPGGLSRIYLTVTPDEESGLNFDKKVGSVIHLAEAKGIELQKDKILAGVRRSGVDIYPHTVAVMWSRDEGAKDMEFVATVVALMAKEEEPSQELKASFRVSGPVPEIKRSMDEILSGQLPAKEKLMELKCSPTGKEKSPISIDAAIFHDQANPGQGMIYLFLKVDAPGGFEWNNLASPPEVKLKPISGIELEKNIILAGKRSGSEDKEDRILAFWWKKEKGAKKIVLDVTPTVWVCSHKEGWCRRFEVSYRITGDI